MRNLCIAAVAAGLIFTPALADPLAPGKPAGVHQAQYWNDNTTWIIVGVGIAAVAIAVAASSGNSGGPTSVTPPSTSTSTTTTS